MSSQNYDSGSTHPEIQTQNSHCPHPYRQPETPDLLKAADLPSTREHAPDRLGWGRVLQNRKKYLEGKEFPKGHEVAETIMDF